MQTKTYASNIGKVLIGGLLGFGLWTLTSHPKSKVNKKMPTKRYKNIYISPQEGAYFKVHKGNRIFHLHHWLIFSLLYLPLLTIRKSVLKSKILHGFFLGSILQGLAYEDRFRIIKKLEEISTEEENH